MLSRYHQCLQFVPRASQAASTSPVSSPIRRYIVSLSTEALNRTVEYLMLMDSETGDSKCVSVSLFITSDGKYRPLHTEL
jgi:hypothetical protein